MLCSGVFVVCSCVVHDPRQSGWAACDRWVVVLVCASAEKRKGNTTLLGACVEGLSASGSEDRAGPHRMPVQCVHSHLHASLFVWLQLMRAASVCAFLSILFMCVGTRNTCACVAHSD